MTDRKSGGSTILLFDQALLLFVLVEAFLYPVPPGLNGLHRLFILIYFGIFVPGCLGSYPIESPWWKSIGFSF